MVRFFGLNFSRIGDSYCGSFGIIANSNLRDLLPVRHLIREMRRHDLTKKKKLTKKMKMTKKKTMTKTFRKHPQRVILDTFDP